MKEAPEISARTEALFEERHGYGHEDENVVQKSGNQIRETHPDQGKDGNQEHHSSLDDLGFEENVVGGHLAFCSLNSARQTGHLVNNQYFTLFPK